MLTDEDYRIVDEPEGSSPQLVVSSPCKIGMGLDDRGRSVILTVKVIGMEHVFRVPPSQARDLATAVFRAADMARAEPKVRRDVYSLSKTVRNPNRAPESAKNGTVGPETATISLSVFCFDGLVCMNLDLSNYGEFHFCETPEVATAMASKIMGLVDIIEGKGGDR